MKISTFGSRFTLVVPPLRQRVDDIMPLANMFLEQEGHHAGFHPRVLSLLSKYTWPGNVRELRNAVKHGAVLSRGKAGDGGTHA